MQRIKQDSETGALSTLGFLLVAVYARAQIIRRQQQQQELQLQEKRKQNEHHYFMTRTSQRRMSFHDALPPPEKPKSAETAISPPKGQVDVPAWHNGNTGMNVNHHFDFDQTCSTYYVRRVEFGENAAEDELHSPKRSLSSVTHASSEMDFELKQTNAHHFESSSDETFQTSLSSPPLSMELVQKPSQSWDGCRDRANTADGRLERKGTFSFLLKQVKKMTLFHETEEANGNDNYVTDLPKRPRLYRSKSDETDDTYSRSRSTPSRRRSAPETHTLHQSERERAQARATYNSSIMPRRVVMIRHGESEGNVNESAYQTKPDNSLGLTKLGWEQARMAGKVLRHEILARERLGGKLVGRQQVVAGGSGGDSSTNGHNDSTQTVHFIVSPYVRTMETFHGLASAWCDPEVDFGHIEDEATKLEYWYAELACRGLTWHEDPRIREQDFGNYQDVATMQKAKKERFKFGAFYYRFSDGESGSDVFDRVSTFLDSLWRSFDFNRSQNYVLVTHGISIRVLLARYFRYSIDQFHMMVSFP